MFFQGQPSFTFFQNMFLQNEGQEEIVENNNKKAKW